MYKPKGVILKKIIIFMFIVFAVIISSEEMHGHHQHEFILETKTGSMICENRLIARLLDYDIIFFGEQHDDSFTHIKEAFLYEQMCKLSDYALMLEMFERDVQDILNDYIEGDITKPEFLERSRPWSNFSSDYEPAVNIAIANKMPIIAANVPRYIAALVSRFGLSILDTLPSEFFHKYSGYNDEYKNKFMETMELIKSGDSKMAKMMDIEKFFKAQLIKDATMAYSINEFLKNNKAYKSFFLCGEFHSNYHLGIVDQLKRINNEMKIVTIAVVDKKDSIDNTLADYIFIKELYE